MRSNPSPHCSHDALSSFGRLVVPPQRRELHEAAWVAYTSAQWKAPEVVATYLRTLEEGGAAYATISRRLTSMSCSISST